MNEDVPPRRWWGWAERDVAIPPGLDTLLAEELLLPRVPPPRRPCLDDVELPPSTLAAHPLVDALRAVCGDDNVDDSTETRARHATGRSYLDLLALRSGRLSEAPDLVVAPGAAAQVGAVLRLCGEAGCAVVPFGGGTSVVGGVRPLRGRHGAVLSLDTRRLTGVHALDAVSMSAIVGAGTTGPEVESALASRDLTLGHFPQSFEQATLGGFAATRSAGQASDGYGRFDQMVLGLRCVTPSGPLVVPAHPASAAGPALRELLLGSEGRFGVITELTLRVRPASAPPHDEIWSLRSFAEGVDALRTLAQRDLLPDVARLSDEHESRVLRASAGHGGRLELVADRYLRLRGHADGCLLVAAWERAGAAAQARRSEAHVLLRRHHALSLGTGAAQSWRRRRYEGPYLRDALLDRGVLVETLETAVPWAALPVLHAALLSSLREDLRESGRAAMVGAHVSHAYPSGASLYLTVLARSGSDPAARWRAAKRRAAEVILAGGGTITHHHAVGTDHLPWIDREIGILGVEALRGVSHRLDPAGIMNPGKLFAD